ncbi:MAG: enoyl-CoA hydratase/isomerase family protein [Pseudomonadota bacterium]
MSATLIHEDLGQGLVRLTLSHPRAANALTDDLLHQLTTSFEQLDADLGVRCAILRGDGGRTFSSGYDTSQLQAARFRTGPDPIGPVCQAMLRGRVPIVGCINGHVLGGAVEIASCCDLRVGQEESTVGIPAVRFGICYAPGGIARLCQALGEQLAAELLLTGRPVSVGRAAQAGFFARVEAADSVDGVALEVARAIASAAPLAVEAMRRILRDIASPGPRRDPERSDLAVSLFQACLGSQDLGEGLAALAEGRPPLFQRS